MEPTNRRSFLRTAVVAAPAVRTAWGAQGPPSDRVNIAVVGIHGKGREHYQNYAIIPNARVSVLCDIDERLFPEAVAEVEKLQGYRPQTEIDIRKVLERKDVDAVSLAVPDYWHALMTIWACQAGKDVYVEKPVSFTVVEGRKMVEAARKYTRIVQAGQNIRSEFAVRSAMNLLRGGTFGKAYRAKVNFARPRASIGRVKDSQVPAGVHWDLYRGPAPMVPFNYNRFHYGWHYFWDTGGTTEVGMNGVHYLDLARWGMGKDAHPVKIHCSGGSYIWDSDQETPTFQTGTFEYPDGSIIGFDVTTLYVPRGGDAVNLFYTSEGYVTSEGGWKAMRGTFRPRETRVRNEEMALSERAGDASFPEASYTPGPAIESDRSRDAKGHYLHWANFVECVRSRKAGDLHCDILDGHRSAAICHLANISYRVGRKLVFNPETEKFVNDPEADKFLTRQYRKPYVLPEKV
jgi:predicted dehydrogenase